ncbi:hypothetical protein [Muricoccus vinaceus]|uniref:Uncharacterized protein n=1 Tax=Muricoccus vinaceus TaxID=424704 RepID=A0ABV6J1E5_9PROT
MLPFDPPLTLDAVHNERHPLRQLSDDERQAMAAARHDPVAKLRFGRHLLTMNPDTLLGRMLVAEAAPTNVETEVMLRDAVRIGLRLWSPELSGEAPVRWYDDPNTRLFMAVVSAYGRTLRLRGLGEEARECADFLHKLDPANRMDVEREVMGDPSPSRLPGQGR